MSPLEASAIQGGAWTPAPPEPRLEEGAIHVWRADLVAVSPRIEKLLSRDEQERAAGILSPRRAELWRRARGVLRQLAGAYVGADPASLHLALDGRPRLDRPAAGRAPELSVSHSQALALYAFAGEQQIGVDVQVFPRRAIDEPALARRAFGAPEAQRLASLPPPQRRRELLRMWSRHEAALKCLGLGIWDATGVASAPAPHLVELDVGAQGAAALACERRPREVRCFESPRFDSV